MSSIFSNGSGGIFGTMSAIQTLKNQPFVSLLVLSDIHNGIDSAEKLLRKYAPKVGVIVFCGDCGDAIADLSSNAELMSLLPQVVVIVRGNGDSSCIRTDEITAALPLTAILEVAGKRIFITHGHLQGVAYSLESASQAATEAVCSIMLFGHTHIQEKQDYNNICCINPGSPSLPRGTSCAGAAIIDLFTTKEQPMVRFVSA